MAHRAGGDRTVAFLLAGWSAGRGPLYRRLATGLRTAIARGDLAPGTRLPAERVLAQELAVSRSTIVAAYAALRDEGWLSGRRGSGTYVRAGAPGAAHVTPSPAGALPAKTASLPLTAGGPDAIDLALACLPGLEGLPPEALSLGPGDLGPPPLARGYAPLGLEALREALAARHTAEGLPTDPREILVTSGAQQAIVLFASALVASGEAVLIESPTYPGAIDAFRRAGARLVPVAVGPEGIDPDDVRDLARRTGARTLYVQPTFQNPTGAVMTEERRRSLARVAADFEITVLEDLTMSDLALPRQPARGVAGPVPGSLAAHSAEGRVVLVGSMGKLLWAGFRVGWMRAPEPLVTRFGRLKLASDLGTSLPSQVLVHRLMGHLDRILGTRRLQIGVRADALERGLAAHLPGWAWDPPKGGLTLWVRLPSGDGGRFAQLAQRHGVNVLPGTAMDPGEGHGDRIRLAFAAQPDELTEATTRLAEAWLAYQRLPRLDQVLPAVFV